MIIFGKKTNYYRPFKSKNSDKIQGGFGTKLSVKLSDMFDVKKIISLDQIHSNKIVEVKNVKKFKKSKNIAGDGMVSDLKGVVLAVKTADCLPIICTDKKGMKIGIAHAGWKGTYSNIAKKLIKTFFRAKDQRENLSIYLGPCIGVCCYQVSQDLYDKFSKKYSKVISDCSVKKSSKYFLNLSRLNYFQFAAEGILPHQIKSSPLCTKCRSDRFYSVRRDGPIKKRMINYITRV